MSLFAKWLERLSLDAVIVAVVWGTGLSLLAGRPAGMAEMAILGVATWLTYVADRLWEVRPGSQVPVTDRHRYYQRHYQQFKGIWLSVFVVAAGYALIELPGWKLIPGWALVAAIAVYLAALTRIEKASGRLLLKRLLVPVIFTAGVLLMSDAWRTGSAIAGSAVLLSGAFSNVLLIAYQENRDTADMPDWLPSLTVRSVFVLLGVAHVALFIHWPVGLAGLACFGGYFVMYIRLRAGRVDRVRTAADGILALSGLLLLLQTY